MAKKNASSLHLVVGSSPLFRVNGRFVAEAEEAVFRKEDIDKIIHSFLTENELISLEERREVLLVKDFGENFRFKINVFYQKDSPSLSLNYISENILDLDRLGLPNNFTKGLDRATGLLVVAGPPSSGKTTTVASIIEKMNKSSRKFVMTLENPIEKIFINKKSIIAQRQIGKDVNSFADGLKHCLDEDLDLVYIDEIREDFELVLPYILELASGNTLVVLEMNADSSIRALEKILNVSCRNLSKESVHYMLADALYGVIAQRLIPNRESGLSLAVEVLVSNFAVKSLVREGNIYQLESVIQNSGEEGMVSMEKSIKDLIISGEIDRQDVGKDIEL
jgi:twitching motility protein PilT